jgi:hypothetical protein
MQVSRHAREATEAARATTAFEVVGRAADGGVTLESISPSGNTQSVGASREMVSRLHRDFEKRRLPRDGKQAAGDAEEAACVLVGTAE